MRAETFRDHIPTLSALALSAVIAGIGFAAVAGHPADGVPASIALLLYMGIEAPKVGVFGRMVLGSAVLTAAAAIFVLPHPAPVLIHGLAQAASLAGLFASVGFLREAAESSRLVRDCGAVMVDQSPGRRYLVLTLGGQLIAVVLNFGVLPLLGAMVMTGNTAEAAGGDQRIVAIRRQRMMTALLRGFAVMTVWSPLSVSFAVTQGVVHNVPWQRLLPQQLALAGLLMILGWLLDRFSFDRPPPRPRGPVKGWGALVRLALVIGAVVAATIAVASALGVRMVMGTILVVPFAALLWIATQHRRQGAGGAVLTAVNVLGRRLAVGLPAIRNEIALLGGAMFLGSVMPAFINPAIATRWLEVWKLPPVALSILVAWSVMGLARFGVPQILTVSLFGGALANLGGSQGDALVLASGLMGAWALSACATPVGAAVLSVARVSGVPARMVAGDWNAGFVRWGGVLLAFWMLGLHGVLGKG